MDMVNEVASFVSHGAYCYITNHHLHPHSLTRGLKNRIVDRAIGDQYSSIALRTLFCVLNFPKLRFTRKQG